jgi:hypothetical protein
VVRELPEFEPATVLSIFSWDPLDAGQHYRSFDILLGQFGDPAIKNAQYSILPFNIPGNDSHHFDLQDAQTRYRSSAVAAAPVSTA